MQAEERARAIVERVRGDGFQAIEALALQFGVTPQTIRRDVNLLCDRGLLRRRHGGVELPPEGENLAYPARQVLNIDAKRRIAQLVARDVPDGASLFFGIGTTPEQCALALAEHAGLRAMTNNLNVALALYDTARAIEELEALPREQADLRWRAEGGAARVARTARRMGVQVVAVASDADRDAAWLKDVDIVVPIGGSRAALSYLDQDALLEVMVGVADPGLALAQQCQQVAGKFRLTKLTRADIDRDTQASRR